MMNIVTGLFYNTIDAGVRHDDGRGLPEARDPFDFGTSNPCLSDPFISGPSDRRQVMGDSLA